MFQGSVVAVTCGLVSACPPLPPWRTAPSKRIGCRGGQPRLDLDGMISAIPQNSTGARSNGQNAFGPPPTNVGHEPHRSTTVNGTVIACPATTRRTEKLICTAAGGA